KARITSEDRFCPECGFDTSTAIAEEPLKAEPAAGTFPVEAEELQQPACPKCKARITSEDRFCPECGFDTSTVKPEVPIMSEPEAATVPVEIEELQPTCPKCKANLTTDDRFCPECGFDTLTTTQAEPEKVEPQILPETRKAPIHKEVKPETPVSKPVPVSPPAPHPTGYPSANASMPQVETTSPKRKKGLLFILLAVLGLAVVAAGGWFGYEKFIKKSDTILADTTATEVAEEPVLIEEPITDTVAVETVPEENGNQIADAKPAAPKKTTPKKQQAQPKQNEPQKNEPAKQDGPLKIVIKPETSKTGRIILSTTNNKEVKSGPLFNCKLKLDKAFIITKITTYHHNWGKGAQPGTIALEKRKDTKGPWQARGLAGDDGTPNGKWICEPNARLEEGNYKVIVSDEKSWSYNSQSGNKGFVVIEGYEAD
ncbi:MAG: hypothetical protein CVV34_02745, partial [Methanomicrobiales archaeon HGW-Methanomicrobiales-5]